MKKYLVTFLCGAVAVAVIMLLFWIWSSTGKTPFIDRAAVIRQVQSLNRLETASYSIDKVVETGTNYDRLREFLFGDKILLVAHGKAVAGVDLSALGENSIQTNGTTLTLQLPAPTLFSATLDAQETSVFSRSQGILTKGQLNLEADARRQAEAAIAEAACEGGILHEANQNAAKQLTALFTTVGFTTVTVRTTTPGTCP